MGGGLEEEKETLACSLHMPRTRLFTFKTHLFFLLSSPNRANSCIHNYEGDGEGEGWEGMGEGEGRA